MRKDAKEVNGAPPPDTEDKPVYIKDISELEEKPPEIKPPSKAHVKETSGERALAKKKLSREFADAPEITLNKQQWLFVRHYLELRGKRGAQTQAARLAKYKTPKISGHTLMRNTNVLAAIHHKITMPDDLNALSDDAIAREFALVGMASPLDILAWNENGSCVVKPSNKMTRDQAKQIASVKTTRLKNKAGEIYSETMEVKLVDRRLYLSDLAKTRGMFRDNLDIKADLKIQALVADVSTNLEKNDPIVNEAASR